MYCHEGCKTSHFYESHKKAVNSSKEDKPISEKIELIMRLLDLTSILGDRAVNNLLNDKKMRTIFDVDDLSVKNCISLLCSLLFHTKPLIPKCDYEIDLVDESNWRLADVVTSKKMIISERVTDEPGLGTSLTFGKFFSLFGSLFNHSCCPNVFRIAYNKKIIYIIAQPVKAGEQLFLQFYGNPNWISYYSGIDERQLKGHFKEASACECEACKKNLPKPQCLPIKHLRGCDEFFEDPPSGVLNLIQRYKKSCAFIENNWKHHPCRETWYIYENNAYFLNEIAKFRL
jgi:SET domain